MSNWYGTSRTNYFHCDRAALEKAIEPFDLEISEGENDTVMLCSQDGDTGTWPSFSYVDVDQDAPDFDPEGPLETEIEFSFEEFVMPHVAEGEVVIAMSAGAEKMRYVSGYAEAFIRHGAKVRRCEVSLDDIYSKAASRFKVERRAITACEY